MPVFLQNLLKRRLDGTLRADRLYRVEREGPRRGWRRGTSAPARKAGDSKMRALKWLAAAAAVGVLSGLATAQPVNDECNGAIAVGEGTFSFDLAGATNSVSASCDNDSAPNPPDVWFNYTASAAGTAVVSTCGLVESLFTTGVAV